MQGTLPVPFTAVSSFSTEKDCNPEKKLFVRKELWMSLCAIAKQRPDEWQCIGKIDVLNDYSFRLTDIRFPKQENGKGSTNSTEDDMGEFLEELIMDDEDPSKWIMWIHSHNTMGAFWSGTDFQQMQDFKNSSYTLALVINAKEEYKCVINMFHPVRALLDLAVYIEGDMIDVTPYMKKIDAVEKKKVYATYQTGGTWKKATHFCEVCGSDDVNTTDIIKNIGNCMSCKSIGIQLLPTDDMKYTRSCEVCGSDKQYAGWCDVCKKMTQNIYLDEGAITRHKHENTLSQDEEDYSVFSKWQRD